MDIEVILKGASRGELKFGGLRFDCALGKTGITAEKREGDHATPAGRFPLRGLFYRPGKVPDIITALPRQEIGPLDGWCDDPDDAEYNRHVRLPCAARHERLWREDDLYDLVVVLGHNDAPAIPDAGSCIFLHVAAEDYGPTEGCVALKKEDLVTLLAAIGPETAINIRLP
ncbi:MAG: L,D-transpeptidase family protein [Sneathiella sp.]|nr:L,D-transpeptidase family protein [Sneathiella sp.]